MDPDYKRNRPSTAVSGDFTYKEVTGVEGINGIWFTLYDKVDGKFLDFGTASESNRFKITSSNSDIIRNNTMYFTDGVGCRTGKEGTTTLTFKYDDLLLTSVKVTLIHAKELRYGGTGAVGSSTVFDWTQKDKNKIRFQIYDKVDKQYVSFTSSNIGGYSFTISSPIIESRFNFYSNYFELEAKDWGSATYKLSYNGDLIATTTLTVRVKVALSTSDKTYAAFPSTVSLSRPGYQDIYVWNTTMNELFQVNSHAPLTWSNNKDVATTSEIYSSGSHTYFNRINAKAKGSTTIGFQLSSDFIIGGVYESSISVKVN